MGGPDSRGTELTVTPGLLAVPVAALLLDPFVAASDVFLTPIASCP